MLDDLARCFTELLCIHADDLSNCGGTCFSVPGSEVHRLYLWQPSLGDQRPLKQKLHRASQSSLRYYQLESCLVSGPSPAQAGSFVFCSA